jgi:hypothetical protein
MEFLQTHNFHIYREDIYYREDIACCSTI